MCTRARTVARRACRLHRPFPCRLTRSPTRPTFRSCVAWWGRGPRRGRRAVGARERPRARRNVRRARDSESNISVRPSRYLVTSVMSSVFCGNSRASTAAPSRVISTLSSPNATCAQMSCLSQALCGASHEAAVYQREHSRDSGRYFTVCRDTAETATKAYFQDRIARASTLGPLAIADARFEVATAA